MRYTKYLFTPHDLARFIQLEDFSVKRENEVLKDLFNNHNPSILFPFREDFLMFHKSITNLVNEYSLEYDELDEAQMIMDEVNGCSTEVVSAPDYYGAYFKLIKLRLLYKADYCKIKMSTLLSNFRYQRRSAQLVTRIKRAMNKLGIIPQTRGYEVCDIADVTLDTMIMFRLATSDEDEFCDETESEYGTV